jgi:hypothetical protein
MAMQTFDDKDFNAFTVAEAFNFLLVEAQTLKTPGVAEFVTTKLQATMESMAVEERGNHCTGAECDQATYKMGDGSYICRCGYLPKDISALEP